MMPLFSQQLWGIMLRTKIIPILLKLILLPINIAIIPLAWILWVLKRVNKHSEDIEKFIQKLERGIRR